MFLASLLSTTQPTMTLTSIGEFQTETIYQKHDPEKPVCMDCAYSGRKSEALEVKENGTSVAKVIIGAVDATKPFVFWNGWLNANQSSGVSASANHALPMYIFTGWVFLDQQGRVIVETARAVITVDPALRNRTADTLDKDHYIIVQHVSPDCVRIFLKSSSPTAVQASVTPTGGGVILCEATNQQVYYETAWQDGKCVLLGPVLVPSTGNIAEFISKVHEHIDAFNSSSTASS